MRPVACIGVLSGERLDLVFCMVIRLNLQVVFSSDKGVQGQVYFLFPDVAFGQTGL